MSPSAPDATIERWCRGFRHSGARPLAEPERAWIRRLRAEHAKRIGLGATILPLVLVIPAWALTVFRIPASDGVVWTLTAWGFGALMLGLPVAILLVRDHCRARAALGRDLARGEAWTFDPPRAGQEDDEVPAAPPFALLEHARLVVDPFAIHADLAHEDVLEVSPHTGAEFYAPLSLRVTTPPADVRFAQRPLSAGERGELTRVRRQLARPRPSTAIAFLVLIALLALSRLALDGSAGPRVPRWNDLLSAALAIVICVRALVRYTRSVLLAGRLARDLETGLVVKMEGGEGPNAEMLPFSRLFWRIAGAPAGWRDRSRAAETLRASL